MTYMTLMNQVKSVNLEYLCLLSLYSDLDWQSR
jgi:hypothetical protein